MRRAALVAVVVALAAAAGLIVALTRGHGSGDARVASVGRIRISRHDLDLAVQHFHDEADAEGRPFPAKGSRAYREIERRALALLLDRAKLELAASRLGIRVTDAQVERRLAASGGGEEAGGEADASAEEAFGRGSAKAQLLTEAVFKRITAAASVSPRAVRAYYRSHRSLYGDAGFSRVRGAIAAQLLAARKNASMSRWLRRARAAHAEIAPNAVGG